VWWSRQHLFDLQPQPSTRWATKGCSRIIRSLRIPFLLSLHQRPQHPHLLRRYDLYEMGHRNRTEINGIRGTLLTRIPLCLVLVMHLRSCGIFGQARPSKHLPATSLILTQFNFSLTDTHSLPVQTTLHAGSSISELIESSINTGYGN
jgi:hypothetical protein